jgi:hypothetical protein
MTVHQLAIEIPEALSLFAAYAAGPADTIAQLTLHSARQTFPLLVRFLHQVTLDGCRECVSADELCTDEESRGLAERLKRSFDTHGSDKATTHNYHFVYAHILSTHRRIATVLEIGIGTNNEGVPSNMGPNGIPGASLRAFRDVLPDAQVYGGDIDQRVLFQEERIRTFHVDQTDVESLDRLGQQIGRRLDLLVDDGLHCASANLNVLIFGVKTLEAGGWLVIEDIAPAALPLWQVVAALLPPAAYATQLVATRCGLVFLMQKNE